MMGKQAPLAANSFFVSDDMRFFIIVTPIAMTMKNNTPTYQGRETVSRISSEEVGVLI